MKSGFAKKVIVKSQRQLMYGSNFYESDVILHTYPKGQVITECPF